MEITNMATQYKHIEHIDVNDDGILEQVAVVKRWEDGSLSYIDISTLGDIDKGRLKAIITSQHADKYELWELMDQTTLSNGLNALGFFHNSFIEMKLSQNAKAARYGGGLETARFKETGSIIGAEFSDPSSGIKEGDAGFGNVIR